MKKNLNLYITTDVHGTLQTRSYADFSDKAQGLARYATALKEARSKGEILVLDNGDLLQGSALMTYFQKQTRSPHLMAQAFNLLGVNYFNIGNHDFNYGQAILNSFLDTLKAPCVSSNIKHNGIPLGQSQLYTSSQGLRIGIIGACTDYIPHWERAENIEGMTFEDPLETVKYEIKILRPKVDFLIVMYHGGFERDLESGLPTEVLTGENVGYALAHLEGVDLLISGHQHRSIITKINKTTLTQCAYNAKEFAWVEFCLEDDQKSIQAKLVKMESYPQDKELLDLIQAWEDKTQIWLDQSVGTLKGHDYLIKDPFKARLHKHPLVSLINTIQMDASGAQLSGVSLFNEPTGFNPTVTTRDLISTYVYPNTLVVKEITGAGLKAYLEKCAEYFVVSDGDIKVNPSYDAPKSQHFNYDMVDGIDYTLKISNPIGQRVIHLTFKDRDILDEDVFSLVINNYRSNGGGDFFMISSCPTIAEINRDMTDILAEYFENHPTLSPDHRENITIVM
jgi:2',3'-cyclic-nucleotide 2'-phosphodiesterase/3'-nucleotidase